jgi:hypothetical protein
VQFGTTSTPPTVVTNQAGASYAPGVLTAGVTYYWRIIARNGTGTTTGPVWSFATAAAPPPPPTSGTVVSDTFTATNGTALASHAPETGGAWVDDQPGFVLNGNRVNSKIMFGDLRSHNVKAPPSADYQVSMDLVWSGATSDVALGVVGRGNGAQFRGTGYQAFYDASRGRWELIKLTGYNQTSLGTYAQPYVAGQTHTLTLGMVGSAITVSVDGVTRISVTDTSISAINNAGIYAHYNGDKTSIVGDNFTVR